ncbi:MAG: hypothetical protein V4543_16245 [Bacteroidota bacterium]
MGYSQCRSTGEVYSVTENISYYGGYDVPVNMPAVAPNQEYMDVSAALTISNDPFNRVINIPLYIDSLNVFLITDGVIETFLGKVILDVHHPQVIINVNLGHGQVVAEHYYNFRVYRLFDDVIDYAAMLNFQTNTTSILKTDLSRVNPRIMFSRPENLSAGFEDSKRMRLKWGTMSDVKSCGWEVQLLKLNHSNQNMQVPGHDRYISTKVDWQNATTVFSEGSTDAIALTVAEGSGYYTWRVRPFADSGNGKIYYGRYSHTGSNELQCFGCGYSSMPKDSLGALYNVFRFLDHDSARNYTYERIFTEKTSIKERIRYADGLNYLRQTLTTLPADGGRSIEHNVLDYSGRTALQLIPVPQRNSPYLSFAEGFARPYGTGKPYRARDFDTLARIRNPRLIPGPDDYYGQRYYDYSSNSNFATPRTSGYSFSRTLFTPDNTGRVAEQALPSKPLSLHSPDSSHTMRNKYSAASDMELVLMFGADAPDGENVEKTISTDANNTTTLTYKTRDGNLLATSVLLDNTDEELLDSLSAKDSVITKSYIGPGYQTTTGIRNGKVLYLAQESKLVIDYFPKYKTLSVGCSEIAMNCPFNLEISISKTDGSLFSLTETRHDTAWHFSADSTKIWRTRLNITGTVKITIDTLLAKAGTYYVEKRIIPTGEGNVAQTAGLLMGNQVNPIKALMQSWLNSMQSACDLPAFIVKVEALGEDIRGARQITDTTARNAEFTYLTRFYKIDSLYTGTLDSNYFKYLLSVQYINNEVQISTRCCPYFTFPLTMKQVFTGEPKAAQAVPDASVSYLQVNPYFKTECDKSDFSFDFEGYAYDYFWECAPKAIEAAGDLTGGLQGVRIKPGDEAIVKAIHDVILKPYMTGYDTPGTFNMMVYKMLTDSLQAAGGAKSAFYDRERLFNCWLTQLNIIKQKTGLCPRTDITVPDTGLSGTISSSVDEQNNGDRGVHDDIVDSNIDMNWLMRWFFSGKIREASRRLRDAQLPGDSIPDLEEDVEPINNKFHYNAAIEFLNCTGFHFAKVITKGEHGPLHEDSIAGFNYSDPGYLNPLSRNFRGYRANISKTQALQGYRPDSLFAVTYPNADDNRWLIQVFKGVKDPVYAFKYFNYKEGNQPALEVQSCFSNPNKYKDTDGQMKPLCPSQPDSVCVYCGVGRIICDSTHEKWNPDQRYAFFMALQNERSASAYPSGSFMGNLKEGEFESPVYYSAENDCYRLWENTATCLDGDHYHTLCGNNFIVNGKRALTKVENDISLLNRGSVAYCEKIRDILKLGIIDSLNAQGFTIDSCVGTANSKTILEAEVDMIVDQMIKECKDRAQVRTYSIVTEGCRDINTPRISSLTGSRAPNGDLIEIKSVKYGTGNASAYNNAVRHLKYQRTGSTSTHQIHPEFSFDSSTIIQLQSMVYHYRDTMPDTMVVLPIYLVPENTIADCEMTRRTQVMSMQLNVGIGLKDIAESNGGCCPADSLFAQSLFRADTVDCPACLRAQSGSSDLRNGKIVAPTVETRIKLDIELNRNGIKSTKRWYRKP